MKRTLAAAVVAGASIWLASVPGVAGAVTGALPGGAMIKVVPGWTYAGHGRLAVVAVCGDRQDLAVVSSKMLRRPVNLNRGPKLLIHVTNATKPGKYLIALWCVAKGGQVDAMDVTSVTIRKWLKGWNMPPAPGLPRCFMPNQVVSTRAPVA